jgi:hypothetical protein
MAKKQLSSMTKAERIEYALENHGIEIPEEEFTSEEILEMIAGWDNGEPVDIPGYDIQEDEQPQEDEDAPDEDTPDEVEPEVSFQEEEEAVKAPVAAKRVKIIIHEQDGDDGSFDVKVGVNGRAYQIKRGVEVDVPPEVVHVLDNAIVTRIVKDPDTNREITKDVRRFNYSVIG